MKHLKRGVLLGLVVAASLLPWAGAQALDTFEKAGVIAEVAYDSMTVFGQDYRIRSSTVLISDDQSRKKFSDLKPGDQVWFKGLILNDVYYVDTIVYQIPEPS